MRIAQYWKAVTLLLFVGLTAYCGKGSSSAPVQDPNGDPNTSSQQKAIYDGTVSFVVQGWEYRIGPKYPADNSPSTPENNARTSLETKCSSLESQLRARLKDSFVSFACVGEKNVSDQPDRVLFEAEAVLKTTYPNIVEVGGEEITGTLEKTVDYHTPFPLQDGRTAARRTYLQGCQAYSDQMQSQYPDTMVVVDCGIVSDSGGTAGWQFSSDPSFFYVSNDPVPLPCGSHTSGSTWTELDPNHTISESISCQFGGTETDVYERLVEMTCNNGQPQTTGHEFEGRRLSTIGRCENARDCGMYHHGDQWWEDDGYYRYPTYCPYGGNRYDLYERDVLVNCFDGRISYTGQERQGYYAGTEGWCYGHDGDHGHHGGNGNANGNGNGGNHGGANGGNNGGNGGNHGGANGGNNGNNGGNGGNHGGANGGNNGNNGGNGGNHGGANGGNNGNNGGNGGNHGSANGGNNGNNGGNGGNHGGANGGNNGNNGGNGGNHGGANGGNNGNNGGNGGNHGGANGGNNGNNGGNGGNHGGANGGNNGNNGGNGGNHGGANGGNNGGNGGNHGGANGGNNGGGGNGGGNGGHNGGNGGGGHNGHGDDNGDNNPIGGGGHHGGGDDGNHNGGGGGVFGGSNDDHGGGGSHGGGDDGNHGGGGGGDDHGGGGHHGH